MLLQSCAEQQPLTGGPKDSTAPVVDPSKYSTPNYQTNFDDDEVILTFNEWIVLQNAYSQVLISPPMTERPKIEVKHKSVVVNFKEELRANTTYTIQFGDAVADYTEGNVAKNLRFVFSTGDFIDSLKLAGEIIDAETGTPKAEVWVMLYDNLADSVPKTERPFYVAKTDKNGQFKFENIRKDSFKVFALDDQNSNYLFDQPSEAIAFHPEPIWLSDSTSSGRLRMRMFKELEALRISKTDPSSKGYARVQFNQNLYDTVQLKPLLPAQLDYQYFQDQDQLYLWFKNPVSKVEMLLETPNFSDTLKLEWSEELEYAPLQLAEAEATPSPRQKKEELQVVLPGQPIELLFPQAIMEWDTSKITFQADSTTFKITNIEIDSLNPRKLQLSPTQWGKERNLLLLKPQAVQDLWGQSNQDSVILNYKVLTEDDLGNILAKVINADSSKSYILQLLDKEENVLEELSFSGVDSLNRTYKGLQAKAYFLQVIVDDDGNGRWSNGDYARQQQAEFVIRSQQLSLRAGWDNELVINLDTEGRRPAQNTNRNNKGRGELLDPESAKGRGGR